MHPTYQYEVIDRNESNISWTGAINFFFFFHQIKGPPLTCESERKNNKHYMEGNKKAVKRCTCKERNKWKSWTGWIDIFKGAAIEKKGVKTGSGVHKYIKKNIWMKFPQQWKWPEWLRRLCQQKLVLVNSSCSRI